MKKIFMGIVLSFILRTFAWAGEKTYDIINVYKIIDGDTIDVMIDLGFDIFYKGRVRFNGINTPESRTSDPREKELGLKAKEYTEQFIVNSKSLTLAFEKREKFGRLLGKIYNEKNECLNDKLIEAGLAREYHGERRGGWFDDIR